MKRAFIAIALLLMTSAAWAFDLDVPLYANTGGGGAALTNAALWSLASGVKEVDGSIQLRVGPAIWNSQSLDMTEIPTTPWTNSGTELTQIVDGELLEIWDDSTVGGSVRFFSLAAPDWTTDLSSASGGLSAYVILDAIETNTIGGSIRLDFDDGTKLFSYTWLAYPAANQSGFVQIGASVKDVAKYRGQNNYIAIQNDSADLWAWNERTNTFDAAIINQAGIASSADRILFGSGISAAMGRSFWDCLNYAETFQATPFLTTSPTSTMGEIDVGCEIAIIPITETTGTGATMTYDYDIGTGWITGKTLAQLRTALVDLIPDTLNLRGNHNSNGTGQAGFRINSGSLCN